MNNEILNAISDTNISIINITKDGEVRITLNDDTIQVLNTRLEKSEVNELSHSIARLINANVNEWDRLFAGYIPVVNWRVEGYVKSDIYADDACIKIHK